MEGKNMKSRADNCDEMGEAIRSYGIDILYRGPRSKRTCNALKLIAAQTSERDGALRKAALGALMVVYELEGPAQFWNLLGDKLSQQQQDLISERQKYMDKELAKKGIEPGWQVRPCSWLLALLVLAGPACACWSCTCAGLDPRSLCAVLWCSGPIMLWLCRSSAPKLHHLAFVCIILHVHRR